MLFGDAFARIDDTLDGLRDRGERVLSRAVARDPHRPRLAALVRTRAAVRVAVLAVATAVSPAVADARLTGRPLPPADPAAAYRFVLDGLRDLPGLDLARLYAAAWRDLALLVQCLLAVTLAVALAVSLRRVRRRYEPVPPHRRGLLARAGVSLERSLVRVTLLSVAAAGSLAVADARLNGHPLPPAGLDPLVRFVVAGAGDLPLLYGAAVRDPALALSCLLAVGLGALLVVSLVYTCTLLVALVRAGVSTALYFVLFAVAVVVVTPVVLAIAAARVLAQHPWAGAGDRSRVALGRLPGRLVAVAAALLPGPYRRHYAEVFESELHDVAQFDPRWWRLLAHSLRVLVGVGHLRVALRSSKEKAGP